MTVEKYLEVARQDSAVLIRVVGLGDMHIAPTMNDFSKSALQDGFLHVVVDLSACKGMDSTFMGTLVGMSSRYQDQGGWLCLINVSADQRRLMEMIGVWHLLAVREDFPLKEIETEKLLPIEDTKKRIALIKHAHEHLVKVDERNKERFGGFLQALEKEIASERDSHAKEVSRSEEPPPPANTENGASSPEPEIIRFDEDQTP